MDVRMARVVFAGKYLGLTPVKSMLLLRLSAFGDLPKFPSYKYLAQEIGCSVATIKRARAELIRDGLLLCDEREREDGTQTSHGWSIEPFEKIADDIIEYQNSRRDAAIRKKFSLVKLYDEKLAGIHHNYTKLCKVKKSKNVIRFSHKSAQIEPLGSSN